jgi:DNA adenine methylase
MTRASVLDYLHREGIFLQEKGLEHYQAIRERFNQTGNPFDFLFLNRSCFNGLMRFNQKGCFNVPFCHKPERFSKAYCTKIANQVAWIQSCFQKGTWELRIASWKETLQEVTPEDFVYLDPPYLGRFADYYTTWDEKEEQELVKQVQALSCGVAISTWVKNTYRTNPAVKAWEGMELRTHSHTYHLGALETQRHSMIEGLLIKPGFSKEII